MKIPTEVEFLEKAKSYVDASWIKGQAVRADGDSPTGVAVCAMGGLSMARQKLAEGLNIPDRRQISSVHNDAYRRVQEALPPGVHSIPSFNDARETTKAKIQFLFSRAICLAKNAATPKAAPSPTPVRKTAASSRSASAAGGKKATGASTARASSKKAASARKQK